IGLVRKDDHEPAKAGSLAFEVDDLQAMHRQVQDKGGTPGEFGIDEWGGKQHRTFFLREDKNGYCYCFYLPVASDQLRTLRSTTLRPSVDSSRSTKGYFLSDVCLEIRSPDTAIFTAKLNGPSGSHVWARAWLSNEIDGTLVEAASPRLIAGDVVTLTVILRD